MKKKLFLCFLFIFVAALTFSACNTQRTVSFETNGGSAIEDIVVENGEILQLPAEPTLDGRLFGGWYYDETFTSPYQPTQPVEKNTTLYAKWCRVENWTVTDPTCTENGERHGTCVDCGNTFSEVLTAHGHNYDPWIYEIAATCTQEGVVGHYYCNNCNKNYDANSVELQSIVIPKCAHTYTTTEIIPSTATCTADGLVEHFYCSTCLKNYDAAGQEIENLAQAAYGHNYDPWIYEIAATCTQEGVVGHYYCNNCNKNYDANSVELQSIVIPKCAHTYTTAEIIPSTATCTEDGLVEHFYCSTCLKNYDAAGQEIENLVQTALGHDWGEWKVTVASTVFDKGKETQSCQRCLAEATRETDYSVQFARVFITTPSNYPDPITNQSAWANWMWSYHPGDQFTVRYEATDPSKSFDCYAQMKIQGGTSTGYPKKNYSIKLFKDAAQTTKNKVEVVDGWGKENKYCLKANYIDVTSARNLVTADIWSEIVASRATSNVVSERDYVDKMVHNGAVDGFPVLLYFNGTYYGLYTFNIPKDKWLFGMSKNDNEALIFADGTTKKSTGALWQSTGFKEVIDTSLWNSDELLGCGWEFEYLRDESAENQAKWVASINEHVQFVLDTYGSVKYKTVEQKRALRDKFRAEAGNYFDIDGCIDYLIFLHCIFGWQDNANKNVLWSTYDGQIWSPNAYDLDTTWGLTWDGTLNLHPDYGTPYADGKDNKLCAQTCGFWMGGGATAPGEDWYHSNMRGNALLDAIMLFYADELEARYDELRAEGAPLSYANIESKFSTFINGIPAEVYAREASDFAERPSNTTDKYGYSNNTDLNQILEFAQYRLLYIDTQYHELLQYNQNYFGD